MEMNEAPREIGREQIVSRVAFKVWSTFTFKTLSLDVEFRCKKRHEARRRDCCVLFGFLRHAESISTACVQFDPLHHDWVDGLFLFQQDLSDRPRLKSRDPWLTPSKKREGKWSIEIWRNSIQISFSLPIRLNLGKKVKSRNGHKKF